MMWRELSQPMPKALNWRDGACRDDTAPGHTVVSPDPEGRDLDDLTPPLEPPAASIPHLRSLQRSGSDLDALNRVIAAIPGQHTQTLITRIATTDDPLKLWALHLELNERGITPALRWPANANTLQTEFVAVMADLLWLGTKYPDHKPAFKGWQQLFKLTPDSDDWHTKAFFILKNTTGTQLSKQFTKGLALNSTQDHRHELMWIQTAPMYQARLELGTEQFEQIRQRLLDHAIAHPDKARIKRPDDIATGNARLYRTHVLSGSNSPEATRKNWQLLTGKALSRPLVSKRIAAIKKILEA